MGKKYLLEKFDLIKRERELILPVNSIHYQEKYQVKLNMYNTLKTIWKINP